MSLSRMASISERESREIEAANASGQTPVVFIHGLWLLPGSWASWAEVFTQAVLPLPGPVLKGVGPFLVNPRTRGRAITLTFSEFRYGWANALDGNEAKQLYASFHVAGSGIALAQMGNANLNPWTQAKVNTARPDRGPLLIIDGEKDHTVPWAIASAAYKRQRRNPAITEITKIPNRGHSLTIDHGWHDVAQTTLDFITRFASPGYRLGSSDGTAPATAPGSAP